MQLLKEVLKEITPEKKKIAEAEKIIERLNKELKKNKINAKAVFGGSYAKNTWLKGDADIDIFVKFDIKYAHEDISKLLGKILKYLKPVKVHGSRDYYQIINKIKFEIIPVLNIKKTEQAHNVTDFSPLHVSWVNKKKLNDEIRIAKKFFKANNLYGAESYIKGFSGHVVDILTIHYGGFMKLIKNVSKWKEKTIIDPEKKYKNKNPLFFLNTSKTQGPLIVIDPVQPDRNAASVVCDEKYFALINLCKAFLKNPSKQFFVAKKKDFTTAKGIVLTLEITSLKGKRDVVGSKILKAFEFLKEKLSSFKVIDSGWEWNDKAKFYYVLKTNEIPPELIRQGPFLNFKEHVGAFKKKHKNTKIENNRIIAVITRKRTKLSQVIKHLLENDYFKEKVFSAKILNE